jgi:hypothetical protein
MEPVKPAAINLALGVGSALVINLAGRNVGERLISVEGWERMEKFPKGAQSMQVVTPGIKPFDNH